MRVGFDDRAGVIVIVGGGVFPPLTLSAHLRDDGQIRVHSLAAQSELLCPWEEMAALDGDTFPTPDAAMAYLEGVFARVAPDSEMAVGIDIAERGQTVIPLQTPPSRLFSLRLVVNGVEYRAPLIAASDVAVTWLNPDFPLDPTDRVTVVYC